MGTPPFFLSRDTNISSIYGIVCPLCPYCVFPLAVPFCASCPCYILSWWKRSRGSCGVNGQLLIYMGRLVVLLVAAFRLLVLFFFSFLVSSLVSFIVSSVRLVAASRCCVPCLSFRFVSFRLCVLSRRVSRWGVLCRWRLVLFLRLVSRFVLRLVVLFVLSCRVAFVAGGGSCGTWAAWEAAMVFSCRHAMLWRWRLVSRVPVGSAGAGR